MGRGSITKEAAGLLYGSRQSGSGPQQIDNLITPPDKLQGLAWPQYIEALADLMAATRLAKPLSVKQRRLLQKTNYKNVIASTIDIKQDKMVLRLVPNRQGGENRLGIYHISQPIQADITLAKGREPAIGSLETLDRLKDELLGRGIDKIGLALSGEELLQCLDQGRDLYISGGSYPLGNQARTDWSVRVAQGGNILSGAVMAGDISGDEMSRLTKTIKELSEEDDILAALASSASGQRAIRSRKQIYVEEDLALSK